jgi:hypothetical protein
MPFYFVRVVEVAQCPPLLWFRPFSLLMSGCYVLQDLSTQRSMEKLAHRNPFPNVTSRVTCHGAGAQRTLLAIEGVYGGCGLKNVLLSLDIKCGRVTRWDNPWWSEEHQN